MKKGQATIFIILGVMLLLIVSALIFFSEEYTSSELEKEAIIDVPGFAEPVSTFLQGCLDESSALAIEYVSYRGGYYERPALSADYLWYDVPYYYTQQHGNIAPSVAFVENQLSLAIKDAMQGCVGEYKTFEKQGIMVKEHGLALDVEMLDGKVIVKADYDIDIERDGISTALSPILAEIDSDMKKYLGYADMIVAKQEEMPNHVRLGYIIDLGYTEDIYIAILYGDNNVVYMIAENKTDEVEEFLFAIGYDWDEEGEASASTTKLSLAADVGYEFEYDLGENASYAAYTDIFNVSDDGMIRFTPEQEDAGIHDILISVENHGVTDYINLELNIKSDNSLPMVEEINEQTINKTLDPMFELEVKAEDDDQLLFNLVEDVGMTIDPVSGKITLDASALEPGLYGIVVVVTDVKGETVMEPFNLRVVE